MIRTICCLLLGLALVAGMGCSRDEGPLSPAPPSAPSRTPALDPELAAGEIVLSCGWQLDADTPLPASLEKLLDKSRPCVIRDFEREVVAGDIAHYTLVLAVGPGQYDVIGLHRVVRERRPCVPIRSPKSLFLVHGMGKDFVGNFMPGRKSLQVPDDFGFAVWLAQHDLDVWGIDNSYTLVPVGPEDFGFAADWGMDKSVDDIGVGIEIARLVRLFTGNGYRKMILTGYSQGAVMGYAFLNGQTQLPPGRRSVAAFVPIDWGLDFDNPEQAQSECEYLFGYVQLYQDGIYGFYDDPDGFYASLGHLAQTDPDGPSPHFEGFTNMEVFLFFTAVPTPPATMHFWAASFTDDGVPIALSYTTPLMATEFWIHWAPMHPPTHLWADFYSMLCEPSVWESHLGEIDMPVFSLEAAGGGGPGMASTLDRLTSADVTRHVVQLLPPEDILLDFGHVDLFTAESAPALAWQPLFDWIENLTPREAAAPPPAVEALDTTRLDELTAHRWTPPAPGRYLGSPVRTDRAAIVARPDDPLGRLGRGRGQVEIRRR